MTKFVLEMEEKQARVICDALDMYSRMGMGQLDVAVEEFLRMKFYDQYYEKPYVDGFSDGRKTAGQEVRDLVGDIKRIVFEHPMNGSWGIFNNKVPWDCREAHDIKQVLRKAVTANRIEELKAAGDTESVKHLSLTVDMDSYMASNPELPPVVARAKKKTKERSG